MAALEIPRTAPNGAHAPPTVPNGANGGGQAGGQAEGNNPFYLLSPTEEQKASGAVKQDPDTAPQGDTAPGAAPLRIKLRVNPPSPAGSAGDSPQGGGGGGGEGSPGSLKIKIKVLPTSPAGDQASPGGVKKQRIE